jgi:HEAT repeat protein
MMRILERLLGLLVLLVAFLGGTAMAQTSAIRAETAAAFEAVRAGDSSRVGTLVKYGDEIIPEVAPLLKDRNADVRLEAIALLDALDSKPAAQAAIPALGDSNSDIGSRAARLVFRSVMRSGAADFGDLGTALSIPQAQAQQDAAKLLLLGFSAAGEAVLRSALAGGPLVKLSDDGPAVRTALPAEIALSLRGARDARARLIERIQASNDADLEFLLRVIGMIDAPEILHALADRTLGNEQPIGGGLPSGVTPRRRMTDLAVEAFIARLGLKTNIELEPVKRYSSAEIDRVRKAVSASMPQ